MIESNFAAARAFAAFGLREKQLGRRESASGPGSAQSAAHACLQMIDAVIEEYGVSSILDLGCGDWNWLRKARWRQSGNLDYEGWEAHADMVDDLNRAFGSASTRFLVSDITTASYPRADLVICRDVLFHLPVALATKVIGAVRDLRSLFISTSYPSVAANQDVRPYLPIENWGFYRTNLDIAPFDLKPYLRAGKTEPIDCAHEGHERVVCLYDFRRAPAGANSEAGVTI